MILVSNFQREHEFIVRSRGYPEGMKLKPTMRITDGYVNFKGKRLITHEHGSVSVDLTTGRATRSRSPGGQLVKFD